MVLIQPKFREFRTNYDFIPDFVSTTREGKTQTAVSHVMHSTIYPSIAAPGGCATRGIGWDGAAAGGLTTTEV